MSVPPAAWINVCHRAGVRVLGTFLVEGNDGVAEAGRLFEKGSEGEYLYATQLTRLAETYGFDGWLMNVESQFPAGWSVNQLQVFLRELNAGLGIDKELIWYDAVTVLNKVHYQNGLTLLNAPFLAATSGLFANYFWRTPQIAATRRMAGVMGRSASVYMGVDCYGRGSWGDGGFGVVVALGEIVNYGLSAALFAPGWTWENFEGKRFYEIEKLFWAGVETTVAVMPLGSSESFYTNFNRGFGDGLWLRGKVCCGPSSKEYVFTVGRNSQTPAGFIWVHNRCSQTSRLRSSRRRDHPGVLTGPKPSPEHGRSSST